MRATTLTSLHAATLSLLTAAACDVPSPTDFEGPFMVVSPTDPNDDCGFEQAHDLGFHALRTETCTISFDNILKTFDATYTFTQGAEAGQRKAYALIEWRAMNDGATGYTVRHVQWHTTISAPDTGNTPSFGVKFPAAVNGVALTGYSLACSDQEPTPVNCWINRIASHNDARWLFSRSGSAWKDAVDAAWERLLPAANNENQAPSAVDFTHTCDELGWCTFDASTTHDPDGQIIEYRWEFDHGHGPANIVVTAEPVMGPYNQVEGTYPVRLTVLDNDGIADGVTKILSLPFAGVCFCGTA